MSNVRKCSAATFTNLPHEILSSNTLQKKIPLPPILLLFPSP